MVAACTMHADDMRDAHGGRARFRCSSERPVAGGAIYLDLRGVLLGEKIPWPGLCYISSAARKGTIRRSHSGSGGGDGRWCGGNSKQSQQICGYLQRHQSYLQKMRMPARC